MIRKKCFYLQRKSESALTLLSSDRLSDDARFHPMDEIILLVERAKRRTFVDGRVDEPVGAVGNFCCERRF